MLSDNDRHKIVYEDDTYVHVKNFVRTGGLSYASDITFTSIGEISVSAGEILTINGGSGTRTAPQMFYIYGDLGLLDTIVQAGDLTCDTEDTGDFVIGRLPAGTYVLSASKDGYKIPSESVSIDTANVEQDLSPEPVTLSGVISGDIADGVTVSCTDAETDITSDGGLFDFSPVLDGERIITPTLVGYSFDPINRTVTVAREHITGLNFTSTLLGYTFLYRKVITIDKDLVGDTVTNFPIVIHLTGLNTAHLRSDGQDIVIFDTDNETRLPVNIEMYNNSTGEMWIWTKVPSISTIEDKILYVYFGCADYTQPAITHIYGVQNVWDAYHQVVYHMNNYDTSHIVDVTSNGMIGTKRTAGSPAEENGQIYKRQLFTAANSDYINVPANSALQGGVVTVSCWFSTSAGAQAIIDRDRSLGYSIHRTSGGSIRFQGLDSAAGSIRFDTVSSYSGGYLTVVYGSGTRKIYINGSPVSITTDSAGNGTLSSNAVAMNFGKLSDNQYYLLGYIEEVHISNTVRSDGWILTEYNNQNNPSTFMSIGSETNDPKVGVRDDVS